MEAEDSVVDNSCERKVVEQLSEVNPDIGVTVLPQALVIETVDLGDLTDFMVTSENSQSVLEAHLQSNEQRYGLDRVVATINIISHEQVVGVWGLSTNLE
jgi:hypothetical protein